MLGYSGTSLGQSITLTPVVKPPFASPCRPARFFSNQSPKQGSVSYGDPAPQCGSRRVDCTRVTRFDLDGCGTVRPACMANDGTGRFLGLPCARPRGVGVLGSE